MQVPVSEIMIPSRQDAFIGPTIQAGLKGSLKKIGQQVPILVDRNMVLIDGLLRLKAAKELGWEKVEVEVAETYEVALDALTRAHTTDFTRRTVTPRRVWEIYLSTVDLMRERVNRIRAMSVAQKKQYKAETSVAHNPLPRALGVSHNTFQAVRKIYYNAEHLEGPIGDFCRLERDRMDQGLSGPSSSLKRLQQEERRTDGATDAAVQRRVLEKVMIHLKSIDSALATLGPLSSEVTIEEMDEWLSTLYTSNTTLFRLRAVLRKERFNQ